VLRGGSYLGARLQVTGEAVWYIHAGDAVYTTPFGPAALPAGSSEAAAAPAQLPGRAAGDLPGERY